MNDFDQAARFAVRMDPMNFMRWLVPDLPPTILFRQWLDTRTVPFPGEGDRTCDTVVEFIDIAQPGVAYAMPIEFQSQPDPNMLDRLLEYLARLRRELRYGPRRQHKYQVISALVNLTGAVQPNILEMQMPGGSSVGLRFQTVVRTMREEDAAATLEAIEAGAIGLCMLPWIPLMRGAGKRGMIEQWKAAASKEKDSRLRTTYAGIAVVFADLDGRGRLWRKELEMWNMGESSIANEWRNEGRAEEKKKNLLRVLELRFPKKLPSDVVTTVEAESNATKLDAWLDAAVMAASPDEFRAAIGG
ncbi:MAG: hypothetical protein M3Y56_06360 [Armatimonadota bacterium]|nr:hypothetical protein [Armatimonadota bacterium]